MGKITHGSRRGAVYIWRRRCSTRSDTQSTGMMQISLRTRELSTARRLGALVSNTAERMYEGMESGTLTKSDVRTYLDAFVDLSRFCAAPSARLGRLSFEGDGTFPAQC
ncbi:hypothetical protein PARPLA_03242 [Rhodobacteraceae bacterium THAF1]|nr:hypothetical protein FIU81_08875 [Palleronia sp. THAF1]VDC31186.1 hypothetical protein PARPLA_03242 [Rhodobacteraceae bacterium THAF1]